ncbi:haloacid dehalogenase type II [Mycobacterium sp. CBMA293]|uniref:haloacid dehalogenase type II n=1 Tax=unclassified Mycolicibacterium TaxID=2636767 RepID=UPI0013292DCC|nr:MULTISPECIES: haloacid dehalogenase type II [unclassified Mycolicibacterium]MUL45041.1 haloacid dehalogenase type II [Mycolicibacterium sp. CBMA 360]MUL95636.1 haloacid dehalogenase type II [Mycolicibacterium sp. CBMA 230]MUL57848.1 haloacid dehalogenase type II [Mycolicibacterium sp. CBMA 335]MUL72703.1 haloacid dehalogenase type II [Mycolicibacterium sp. CBMA 311]MUM07278.1 haloacid dehalogenase, type II [Mycolicibacterium sp. CBMA 213]
MAAGRPAVLVFDVNETLVDIESLGVHFDRVFGDAAVLREWFGQLVTYSMTATMSGCYVDFFTLGRAVLHMIADIHGVRLAADDLEALAAGMRTMPAHPDVDAGLTALRGAGYRLVTLTNSPHVPGATTPVENAGLAHHFERQFTVDEARLFKPAKPLYVEVARQLGVPAGSCMMVAAHVWDTIGAQAAGFAGALITRPGNAPLPAAGLPQPDLIATDLADLAAQLGMA